MVKDIKISDFDYPLPDDKIARHPLAQRDSCKLLVSTARGDVRDLRFDALPSLLPGNALMVCNDTRVINARIKFTKATGSQIEVFLLEPIQPNDYVLTFQARTHCVWSCMVGNLKRWKSGPLTKQLTIGGRTVTLTAMRGEPAGGNAHCIEFSWDDPSVTFASIVDAAGYIPIPPYLKRDSEAVDADDYQTVYARIKGSVAAPTAGLHFTPELFETIRSRGVEVMPVTLHVGAGTFQPVKSEEIGGHPMHTEVFSVDKTLIDALVSALENGRPVVAVGTTSVRTLESLPYIGLHLLESSANLTVSQWEAYDARGQRNFSTAETIAALRAISNHLVATGENTLTASTSIMIAPGFRWRIVDMMVTNFHQPQSTLLLLVASFLGDAPGMSADTLRWRSLYNHALASGYRFLSYGDACLFRRAE